MKKISLVLLTVCWSVLSFAGSKEKDKFNFGFRAAVGLSGIDFEPKPAGYSSLINPNAGFLFEIPILPYLEIRPELNFGSQGYRSKILGNTYSTWMGYAQLPILIRGQYGSEKVRGFIQAGPQFGYGAFVLTRLRDSDKIIEKESYGFDEYTLMGSKDGLNPFDMGIAGGAGVEFPKIGHLEAEIRFYKGFNDINNWPDGRPSSAKKITNSSIQFSLAFKI